ncbi:hypothetical protein K1719_029399 [Acacia pycnantha]|nr:hypothetical protein K1719_029399 [Acacia pycnantha]
MSHSRSTGDHRHALAVASSRIFAVGLTVKVQIFLLPETIDHGQGYSVISKLPVTISGSPNSRFFISKFQFKMRKEQSCTVACRVTLDAESAKNFQEKNDDECRVNMILDNLLVAVLRQRRDGGQSTTYEHGFRVGFKRNYQGV